MNLVKNETRNRLGDDLLDDIMRIKYTDNNDVEDCIKNIVYNKIKERKNKNINVGLFRRAPGRKNFLGGEYFLISKLFIEISRLNNYCIIISKNSNTKIISFSNSRNTS